MTNADEKLCLQWNDFKENVSSAFGDLRQDKEFTDVTLACEDGQQVEAHKVILVASSPFFLNILKRNKHPHPLIYMRGVRPENLMAMVDFFYHGEANVYQENLDSFLVLAEELQLKFLGGNKIEKEAEVSPKPTEQKCYPKSPNFSSVPDQIPVREDLLYENIFEQAASEKVIAPRRDVLHDNGPEQETSEKVLALTDQVTKNTDMERLDQQVKSMMLVSENANPYKKQERARICKVCGKEGAMANIMNHIESHHIAEISIPCSPCGTLFRSRNSLAQHKYTHHKS